MRILTTSVTAVDRRQHTETILQHYYQVLNKVMDEKPPFTFDQVLEAYKRCFKFGALGIVGGLAMLAKSDAMLGENAEAKREDMLARSQALVEDVLSIEKELLVPGD